MEYDMVIRNGTQKMAERVGVDLTDLTPGWVTGEAPVKLLRQG